MSFWTYANLAGVTGGRWLVEPEDAQAEAAGLWHDTRDLKQGQAYLAIKGEHFDGHEFVDKAFEAGAGLAIVQRVPRPLAGRGVRSSTPPGRPAAGAPAPILEVEDTVRALQDLARAYRGVLKAGGCKVIGVAGSNGKTTTRHLIHHVLTHAGLQGTQSEKSFNNHLGVPLTLLQARPDHDFVACEIGTNHPGEVDFLGAIVRPDIAVITNIGEEHLEFFGDLEGVAKEESSILPHVEQGGATVIGALGVYAGKLKAPEGTELINSVDGAYQPAGDLQLPGEHSLANARMACCVAGRLGLSKSECDLALRSARPAPHRGELLTFGYDVLVFDDCYNANPSSMRAAIDTLADLPGRAGRKVAVLGDMFELGEAGPQLHQAIAYYAIAKVWVFLIGEQFAQVETDMFVRPPQSEWTDRTPGDVADFLEPGDTVLLKASRGMRLERLIPAIERRFGKAEPEKPK